MTTTTARTARFADGARVDVVLHHVEVSMHAEDQITVWADGFGEPITIPTHDDTGHPLPCVEVAPALRPGQVYRARRDGTLLFATSARAGVQLVSADNTALRFGNAIEVYGPLDLVAGPGAVRPVSLADVAQDARTVVRKALGGPDPSAAPTVVMDAVPAIPVSPGR